MKNETKKKRYFPSSFLVIFGLMFLFIIISWLGQWSGSSSIHGVGLFDAFPAVWHGFVDKADVILFIFAVGGILGILTKLKVIDAGIEALVKKLGDKVVILIPLLMFMFGLGGTSYGMWEETIAFFPVLIPVFKKAGYGPFTAVLVILIGAGTGCMASTVNPFATGAAFAAADGSLANDANWDITNKTEISQGLMMASRWLTFIVFEAIAITLVTLQAVKYKKNGGIVKGINNKEIEKVFLSSEGEELEFTKKRKWTLGIFVFAFLFMIIAYLPWGNWFEDTQLQKLTDWWNENLFFIGTTTSTGYAPWGQWYFISVASVFVIASILIFAINFSEFVNYENGEKTDENKEEVFIGEYMTGVKDVMSVSLLIAVAAGLGRILDATGIGGAIANSASGLGESGFVLFGIAIFFMSLMLSFLVPSTSGFAGAFIPVFTGIATAGFSGEDQTTAIGIVILAFVLANGLANLVTPTSAALMGYTSYAKVPYVVWLKETWKITTSYFVASLVMITTISGLASAGMVF